jgi:ribonucleoside-diphosphate reductase alpha chain
MYLETRDLGDMMSIYSAAWERGVKTTYYLHMKPRHTAEQSTVRVNKAETIDQGAGASNGRRGFGSAAPQPAAAAPAGPARRGFGGLGSPVRGTDNKGE